MKVTKFLVLSFLLFAFTAASFPEAVQAEDHAAVLDAFHHEVLAGARYRMVTDSPDNTTTLEVTATNKTICHSDVILSTLNDGLPIVFSPEDNDTVIREDTYLNLNFNATTCAEEGVTTMWKIGFLRTLPPVGVVTTGGVDRVNRFIITKYEDDNIYQLSFCPRSELLCNCSCVPVGPLGKNLAPTGFPVPFVFQPYGPKLEHAML